MNIKCLFGVTSVFGGVCVGCFAGDIQVNNAIVQGYLQLTNGGNSGNLSVNSSNYIQTPRLMVPFGYAFSAGEIRLGGPGNNGGSVDFAHDGNQSWRIGGGDGTDFWSNSICLFKYYTPNSSPARTAMKYAASIRPDGNIILFNSANTDARSYLSVGTDGYLSITPGIRFSDGKVQNHAIQTAVFATNVPAGTTSVVFTHNFGAIPHFISCFLVCQGANNGYSAGGDTVKDEVKADGLVGSNGKPYFNLSANATNIIVSTDASTNLFIVPKMGGGYVDIYGSRANWYLRVNASFTSGM